MHISNSSSGPSARSCYLPIAHLQPEKYNSQIIEYSMELLFNFKP